MIQIPIFKAVCQVVPVGGLLDKQIPIIKAVCQVVPDKKICYVYLI